MFTLKRYDIRRLEDTRRIHMKCPFCKEEMKTGTISQDRYALKWVPEESDKGLLNFTPFIKGIKLTSMSNLTVKVFHCENCRKFIIDEDNLH